MADDISSYIPDTDRGRSALRDEGKTQGESRAKSDYPTFVSRDRRQIEQQAMEAFQAKIASKRWFNEKELRELQQRSDRDWKQYYNASMLHAAGDSWQKYKAGKIGMAKNPLDRWDSQVTEARQQFVTAYVTAYFGYIEQEDARRRPAPPSQPVPQPKPQPTPQPSATPQPATSTTGATIRVKNVDRDNPNQYVYYLELVDPGFIDGAFEIKDPLVVYFEGAAVPETPTSTTSSSYGASSTTPARGYASSSAAYEARSVTPQKPRKPLGSYWKK
jgi:hypothetical protein